MLDAICRLLSFRHHSCLYNTPKHLTEYCGNRVPTVEGWMANLYLWKAGLHVHGFLTMAIFLDCFYLDCFLCLMKSL